MLISNWLQGVGTIAAWSLMVPVSAGQTVTEIIDSSGDGAGNGLAGTVGVEVGPSGSVYVSGSLSHTVFKVEPNGTTYLLMDSSGDGAANALDSPAHLCVDGDGNLFVPGAGSHNVFMVAPGGQVSVLIDSQGDGVNALQGPADVVVDSAGNVFVIGSGSDNAFKITPAGVITQILDADGAGPGRRLEFPSRVDVDDSGNVYVLGAGSRNVLRVAPDGSITELIDAAGAGPGSLLGTPRALAIGPSGDVFVCGDNSAYASILRITEGEIVSLYYQTSDKILGLAVDAVDAVFFTHFVFNVNLDDDGGYRLDSDGTETMLINSNGDGMGNVLWGLGRIAVGEARAVYVVGQTSNNVFRIDCGPPTAATATPYNGSDANLDTLTASKAVIGTDWTATIDPIFVRGPGSWVLFLRGESSAGTIFDLGTLLGLPAAGNSELLVDLASPFGTTFFPAPHTGGGTTTTFTARVPYSCSLVGQSWFAQAIVTGALPTGPGSHDPWFSSAVGGVVGNQ